MSGLGNILNKFRLFASRTLIGGDRMPKQKFMSDQTASLLYFSAGWIGCGYAVMYYLNGMATEENKVKQVSDLWKPLQKNEMFNTQVASPDGEETVTILDLNAFRFSKVRRSDFEKGHITPPEFPKDEFDLNSVVLPPE